MMPAVSESGSCIPMTILYHPDLLLRSVQPLLILPHAYDAVVIQGRGRLRQTHMVRPSSVGA